MAPHVIGMTGYARSGKDTAARAIKQIDPGAAVRAFADALRVEVARAFELPTIAFTSDEYKDIPLVECAIERCTDARFVTRMKSIGQSLTDYRAPRDLMQLWGTEYRRALDGDAYWIDRLFNWFRTQRDAPTTWVIPDVRYPSEATAIMNQGGEVWRIVHPNVGRRSTHSSELYVPHIAMTRVVFNDGTADELMAKVQRIYTEARTVRTQR
ncbi:MAG: hypothetical protein ACOYB0_08390 [Polynucleobacter sp.]